MTIRGLRAPVAIVLLTLALLAPVPLGHARAADGSVFRSDDAGRTWTQLETSPAVQSVFALVTNVSRPDRLLLGSDQSLWLSDDAGDAWSQPPLPGASPDEVVYALAVDPDDPPRVWAATEGGVFRSQDAGTTWTTLADQRPKLVALVAQSDGSGGARLYGGGAEGLKVSEDGGATWRDDGSGLDGAVLAVAVTPDGDVLVGTTSGVFARDDPAAEFVPARGLPRGSSRALLVTSEGTVYAAVGSNVYQRGNGWAKLATLPLATNGDAPGIAAIVRTADHRLLLGTEHGLHASPEWKLVPPFDAMSNLEVAALAQDPSDPNRIYLGASSLPNALGYAKVGVLSSAAVSDMPDGRFAVAIGLLFLVGGVLAVRYARRPPSK